MLDELESLLTHHDIVEMQKAVNGVHISDALLDYTQALVRFTRETPDIELGLSPRGAQDLVNAARCWAMISGHSGVRPEDIKCVFIPVAGHRLRTRNDASHPDPDIAAYVLESVPVP
jgi:MoxR-like ATPase